VAERLAVFQKGLSFMELDVLPVDLKTRGWKSTGIIYMTITLFCVSIFIISVYTGLGL
jgi:hypothetical protein